MAILLEELQRLLSEASVDNEKYKQILKAAEELEEEKKADRSGAPKSKNELVVTIKGSGEDMVAHVWQISAESDAGLLMDKINKAATSNNLAAKRAKSRVENFDDVAGIKRKFLKEENVALKTKTDWVRVIQIPEGLKFGGFDGKPEDIN